jgi:hypothetical protein
MLRAAEELAPSPAFPNREPWPCAWGCVGEETDAPDAADGDAWLGDEAGAVGEAAAAAAALFGLLIAFLVVARLLPAFSCMPIAF